MERDRTHFIPIQPQAFLEETVQLPHLRHRSLRPPILLDYAFYLFSEWLNVLWLGSKVEQCVSEGLSIDSHQKWRRWFRSEMP